MSNWAEPRECDVCGDIFMPTHWTQKICKPCREAIYFGRGRKIPNCHEGPKDREKYERELRDRNIAKHEDRIVAIGYAARQKEQTLKMVGKVEI